MQICRVGMRRGLCQNDLFVVLPALIPHTLLVSCLILFPFATR